MFDSTLRKRVVRGWIAALLLVFAVVPSTLGASTKPTLDVTIVCTALGYDGEAGPAFTIDHYASVTGFPASSEIVVDIIIDDFGDARRIFITTGATGTGSGQLLHDPSYVNSGATLPTGEPWTATAYFYLGTDPVFGVQFGSEIASVSGTLNCGGGPADKEACKKGGAVTYGLFKNQGDCVSFVSTGFSNAPAGP